jgi:glucokinase
VDLGIVDEVKAALGEDKAKAEEFFKLTASALETVDLKSVFIANRAKNSIAQAALSNAAKRLGVRIAYLVNLLNPQAVVIGGGFEEAGEDFLKAVSFSVKEWAFGQATDDLKIMYSQLKENAVAMGAASLVMQKAFGRFW